MTLNKVFLIGNLTRDPEVRTTPAGQQVCTFGLATSRVWTDAEGKRQERTEFHNIVAWRRLAEICGQYLAKGRKAFIEGYLQTRDWEGQDGVKRTRTEIICDNMIMLDRAPQGAGGTGGFKPSAAPAAASEPSAPAAPPAPAADEIKVEDIPF